MNFCDNCGRVIDEEDTIEITVQMKMFEAPPMSYTERYCDNCFNKGKTLLKYVYKAYEAANIFED